MHAQGSLLNRPAHALDLRICRATPLSSLPLFSSNRLPFLDLHVLLIPQMLAKSAPLQRRPRGQVPSHFLLLIPQLAGTNAARAGSTNLARAPKFGNTSTIGAGECSLERAVTGAESSLYLFAQSVSPVLEATSQAELLRWLVFLESLIFDSRSTAVTACDLLSHFTREVS